MCRNTVELLLLRPPRPRAAPLSCRVAYPRHGGRLTAGGRRVGAGHCARPSSKLGGNDRRPVGGRFAAADPTRRRVVTASALMLTVAGTVGCALGQAWPWARPRSRCRGGGAQERDRPRTPWSRRRSRGAGLAGPRGDGLAAAAPAPAAPGAVAGPGRRAAAPVRHRRRRPERAEDAVRGRAAVLADPRRDSIRAVFLVHTLAAVVTPSLAQLMASISASEAAHAALLDSAGSPR